MKQNLVMILLSVMIGFTGAFMIAGQPVSAEEVQEGIAEQILRFHVLANSDSEEDQALKLKVKEHVIDYLQEALQDADNLEQTKLVIQQNIPEIIAAAEEVLRENGYSYSVTAEVKEVYFPVKTYGNYTFPAGRYEALQIEIGAAKGKNWWCVLYPNLCFIDAVHAVVDEPEEQVLQNILTEEEYDAICDSDDVRIKFRFAEWLKEIL